MGPRYYPCGTPMVTSLTFESVPHTLQNCFRLDRYDLNQERSRLQNQEYLTLTLISASIFYFLNFPEIKPKIFLNFVKFCCNELTKIGYLLLAYFVCSNLNHFFNIF